MQATEDSRPRAFTLLELVIAVTLIAMSVGVATLSTAGLSASARLQTAVGQVATIYRLAAAEAARSGRPTTLLLDERRCLLQRPTFDDGKWQWRTAMEAALVRGVRIRAVAASGAKPTSELPLRIPVAPGRRGQQLRVSLATTDAVVVARINPSGRIAMEHSGNHE